jgi:formate dehydrogenase (coenzyme F420) beta subunit
MTTTMLDRVKAMLASANTAGVLGLSLSDNLAVPKVFAPGDDLNALCLEPKWPLAKTAWRLAVALPEGERLGLVCRGCDARAVIEMEKAGQLAPGRIVPLTYPCTEAQALACRCATPYPPGEEPGHGEPCTPTDLDLPPPDERLAFWSEHFSRCIKCYGCRNACPVCLCPSCKLEQDDYVSLGGPPPEPLVFHLIRAMHVADRCIGCGACQEACPAGLPLLDLHLALRRYLFEKTGFVSGTPELSPVLTVARQGGPLGAPPPAWDDGAGGEATGGGHGR